MATGLARGHFSYLCSINYNEWSPSHSNLILWEFNSSTTRRNVSKGQITQSFKEMAIISLHVFCDTYLGGHKTSSRNSSILFTSVLTSLLKVINGGWVPGAKFCRSTGFLLGKIVVKIGSFFTLIEKETIL